MESYDRLFPSQDTMPRGGFGNLIALPLQHEPRKEGNAVFVDDQLEAYPDDRQWAYLASVRRIDPGTVELIAREATRVAGLVRQLEALAAAALVTLPQSARAGGRCRRRSAPSSRRSSSSRRQASHPR